MNSKELAQMGPSLAVISTLTLFTVLTLLFLEQNLLIDHL